MFIFKWKSIICDNVCSFMGYVLIILAPALIEGLARCEDR